MIESTLFSILMVVLASLAILLLVLILFFGWLEAYDEFRKRRDKRAKLNE